MNQALHKRTVADIPIIEFGEVTSTHDIAREIADGTRYDLDIAVRNPNSRKLLGVISAQHQIKGRGRRERVWESKSGSSMLSTFILPRREDNPMIDVSHLMVVVSKVLTSNDCKVKIKWPNDLVVEEEQTKKIGGCLSEIYEDYIFVGIGINLSPGSYGPELDGLAVSLLEAGIEIKGSDLVDLIVSRYIENVESNISDDEIWHEYKHLCVTLKKNIRIDQINESFEGVAKDVNIDGSLSVEKSDGEMISVTEGDVVHVR